jgi:hypothetical protein
MLPGDWARSCNPPLRNYKTGGTMNKALIQLQIDLKKFGLNPADWKLQKMKRRYYKIANVRDQDFYFLGEARQKNFVPQWTQIQLASF